MKIAELKRLVSQHTGVSIKAMEATETLKTERVCLARGYVFWLARRIKHRPTHIARYFPCSHSIVIRNAHIFGDRRYYDWDLREQSDRLLREIKDGTSASPQP